MLTKECKKEKGKPMPTECEICESYKAIEKSEKNINNIELNSCFEQKMYFDKPYSRSYKPFTNSKKEIIINCKDISHVRTLHMW